MMLPLRLLHGRTIQRRLVPMARSMAYRKRHMAKYDRNIFAMSFFR